MRLRSVPCLLAALLAIGGPSGHAKDDLQPRIDEAIRKGADYLAAHAGAGGARSLACLALLHAGRNRSEPMMAEHLNSLLTGPLSGTYQTALVALTLVHVDRQRHQTRIAQCAQALIDSQCANGQWSYGSTLPAANTQPTSTPEERRNFTWIRLRRHTGFAPPAGDNSNTQFALLGLWAAHLAKVRAPDATWQTARKYFRDSQGADGGWSYGGDGEASSYGSMTCAGLAALAICERVLEDPGKTRVAIDSGCRWVRSHFTVQGNPGIVGHAKTNWYYYLYSLERAGTLLDLARFGDHDWYDEGARVLLSEQQPDGSWGGQAIETSFAILFLRRATRSISGAGGGRGTVSTPDDDLDED